MGAPIRIVFNALYLSINTILFALKIDDPITLFMASTMMARCDPALVIASTIPGFSV
jgi:hypothetical protein